MAEENLSVKSREALAHIRNWIMKFGRFPSVRDIMEQMKYKSPRSVTLIINELLENGFVGKKSNGGYKMIKDLSTSSMARTIEIPLLGSISCGGPLLAEENIEGYIPISVSMVKPGEKYFILKAVGDSMNKADINSGDLVLIKQQPTAENGQIVVALIDDDATIKEYQHNDNVVVLIPRSTNPKHRPIILEREFQIQGIVMTSFPT